MINIFCNRTDTSIDHVLDWLEFYNVPYKRYNPDTFFNNYPTLSTIDNNDSFNHQLFWYYKWNNSLKIDSFMDNESFTNGIQKRLDKEREILFNIFWKNVPVNNTINHPLNAKIDKYTQLIMAKKIGLDISNTLLTSKKEDVLSFRKDNTNIVTKNFDSGFFIHSKTETLCNYTTILNDSEIDKLPETFFSSLFQSKIEKQFELKIIYINGKVYPVALIPEDKNTDIRRFNNNMTFPYEIPFDLTSKLQLLMNNFNLSYGTIDMILDNNGQYIFLEVNPSGQFLGYSNLCNYKIEEKLAFFLKEKLKQLNNEK